MGFKKYKWHKVADKDTDIRCTAGAISSPIAGTMHAPLASATAP